MKISFGLLFVLSMFVCAPATAQTEYKAGKWQHQEDTNWNILLTGAKRELGNMKVSVLVFGESLQVLIQQPCEDTESKQAAMIILESSSEIVKHSGCPLTHFKTYTYNDWLGMLKEVVSASDAPSDVLGMLAQLPKWLEVP